MSGAEAKAAQALALRQLWTAILEEPDDAQRVDALISHPQAERLVAQVPAQDLYLLARRHGLADAAELVALSTPEQFRTFVDLDGWRRDALADHAVADWLRAVARGSRAALPSKVAALDNELVGLLLKRWTVVYAHDPDEPLPDGHIVFVTEDRTYYVELLDSEQEDAVLLLLEALRARLGPLGLAVLLARLAGELSASLEEQELHWRNARLEDLGFLPYSESLALYAPLPPEAMRVAAGPVARAPDAGLPRWLARVDTGPLLSEALDAASDDLRARLEQDMVHLFNAAMIAGAVEPDDDEATRRVLGRARGYVEVALQMLTFGDRARAAMALAAHGPRKLFRFTVTGLLGLMRRARALGKTLQTRLEPGEQAWLDSLSLFPPRRSDDSEFVAPEHVREAEVELLHLEAIAAVLSAGGVWAALPPDSAALRGFGTVLARSVLGVGAPAAPLTPQELQRFLSVGVEAGQLGPAVRERATALLSEALGDLARGARLAGRWCAALDAELGALDPAELPDPKFVGGVLLCGDDGVLSAL